MSHSTFFVSVALSTLAATMLACSADMADGDTAESSQPASHEDGTPAGRGYGYELRAAQRLGASQPAFPASPAGSIPADWIAPEVVHARISEQLPALRACYSSALERNPNLRGEVVVVFRVDPSGAVESSKVDRSSVDDPQVGVCLTHVLRKITYPASAAGTMQVYYPFALAPEDLANGT